MAKNKQLDLKELERQFDELLSKETTEYLNNWLEEYRIKQYSRDKTNYLTITDEKDKLLNVIIKNEDKDIIDISFYNENGQIECYEFSPSQLLESLNEIFDDRLK